MKNFRNSLIQAFADLRPFALILATSAVALILTFIAIIFHVSEQRYDIQIDMGAVRHESGHLYIVRLPPPASSDALQPDSLSCQKCSTLMLKEDAVPLGPAHSQHDLIRKEGSGAYSHWNEYLYFSTRDNSDPRTNGREYRIEAAAGWAGGDALATALVASYALLALSLVAHVMRRRSAPSEFYRARISPIMRRIEALQIDAGLLIYIVIILVAWALVNYTFLQRVENFVCISYDTLGYIRFRIFRPPGYGLFVNAVRAVLDDARWIIPIQLNAMLFSMALFGYAVGRLAKSRWFGLVLTIMMFATLPVLQYSYHLISESIFIAFLLLHFAFVALFIDSRSWTFAILSGFMLFCLIAVRPAGYSVAVTIPLLLWFMRRDWPRILGGVMGSFLGGLIFMGTANFIHHGIWSGQSLAGLSLLGHVAFLIDERDAKGEHRDLIATIAANNENISRPLRETAFPHEHWKRTSEAYNQLLWRGAFPVISDHVREGETDIKYDAGDQTSEISTLNELSDGIWRQTSEISMDIATQVMSEKPLSYVRHVLANFYGMWHVLLYGTSSISENLLQCIKASQDIVTQHGYLREKLSEYLSIDHLRDENIIKTLELRSDTQTGFQHFWLLVSRNQNIVLAIGIPISLLFLLIGVLSPKEPLTIFVSFCAVQIFAYFIFISAVQAALVRYSVPFIPIFYVILFGGGLICSRMILKRLTS